MSGPYLAGGIFSARQNVQTYLLNFLNVHILLFGGVTAYNSYWDKDKGPIGGLKHPPKMEGWMLYAAWALQILGILLGLSLGAYFTLFFAISILLFWLYSSPNVRLKEKPIASLVTISLATAFTSFYLGYFALGAQSITVTSVLAAIGATLIIASMYPLSQLYQILQDKQKRHNTFTAVFGTKGARTVYLCCYPAGLLLMTFSLTKINIMAAVIFFGISALTGFVVYLIMRKLKGIISEYAVIMRIKYVCGCTFSLFFLILMLLRLA
ncbi:UbiA family prenyltransferase [Candidatus Woesearchaeota archaeon]|nr:UbiA family prenyltransferase [Candidatus Woesearchaeota archaeon]